MRDDGNSLHGWRAGLRWLLTIMALLLPCGKALAQSPARCNGVLSYSLPRLNANMHAAAVGAPISPWAVKNGGGVSCHTTVFGYRAAHLGELFLSMPGRVATYAEDGVTYDVFPTNVTGIGFVLGYQPRGERSRNPGNFCTQTWRSARGGEGPGAPTLRTNSPCEAIGTRDNVVSMGQAGGMEYINFSYSMRVRFIRTGATLGSGSISTASLGRSCYREFSNRGADLRPPLPYTQISGCTGASGSDSGPVVVPAAATCTIATAHLNRSIPLLPTRVRDFNGKGTTTVPTPVAFRVTCQNAARLSYSFTGEMADAAYPSVLNNRALGVRSATGIGIQILDADNNNAPVALGASRQVTGTINTTRDLNFVLRYFSLEDQPIFMKPGVVEAQATINLTFQ